MAEHRKSSEPRRSGIPRRRVSSLGVLSSFVRGQKSAARRTVEQARGREGGREIKNFVGVSLCSAAGRAKSVNNATNAIPRPVALLLPRPIDDALRAPNVPLTRPIDLDARPREPTSRRLSRSDRHGELMRYVSPLFARDSKTGPRELSTGFMSFPNQWIFIECSDSLSKRFIFSRNFDLTVRLFLDWTDVLG